MIRKHPVLTVLALLLCIVILAFAVTGVVIMSAASGSSGEFEYLVVLGTKVEGTEPSSMLRDRIEAAAEYLEAHPNVICIVSGGKGDEENLSEAQCMWNELTALGIDESRIRLEDRAATTQENLQFSLELMEAETGSRPEIIGILSSEFHLLRANMFAGAQNVQAVTIPAKTSDASIFVRYFLREIVMVWYYSAIGA